MEDVKYFHTIVLKGSTWIVRYIDLAASEVKALDGKFKDVSEATKAFEAATNNAISEYLEPSVFTQNVRSLAGYKVALRKREEAEKQQKGQQ